MHREDVGGKKEYVKGGGVCIYCGCDGRETKLHSEHTMPYSLGGSTELLEASCGDCGGVTSYLDGYLGSGLIKSTIRERRQGRRRRGNFARAYRSELRCV
jgi:5-methylcytosine-specific restriction endonuclease McrA